MTRCSWCRSWARPPPSSPRPTRTASATARLRCASSWNCSMPQIAVERPGQIVLMALPPLALYVHIPWCVRKCPYCDFNSHERGGDLPETEYVAKLLADLEGLLPSVWGRRLVSVFIGGGTPSLFSPEAIDTLLSGVRARLPLEPIAEITLAAHPGTPEAARLPRFRRPGVH